MWANLITLLDCFQLPGSAEDDDDVWESSPASGIPNYQSWATDGNSENFANAYSVVHIR